MKEIGLYPSDTAAPGGKETGQNMGHYITPGGPFARVFAKLQATGFRLRWQSRTFTADPARKAKSASKTKFNCPECGQNAWAKADALLICGSCYEDGDGDNIWMLADARE
jgi:hypothetical protein